MRTILARVSMLSAVLTIVGCKPVNSTTEQKSLDNFAGGNVTNQCVATPTQKSAVESLLAKDGLGDSIVGNRKSEVISAIGVVPIALLEDILRVAQISVVANAASEEYCGEGAAACWGNDASGRLKIYVNDDSKDIAGFTVRALGYYFSQVAINVQGSDTNVNQIDMGSEDEQFVVSKRELARRFIPDLANSQNFQLTALNRYFDDAIFKDDMSADAALKAFEAIDRDAQREFNDFVYAEAFDSFYCSDASRKSFAQFTGTYSYYQNQVKALMDRVYEIGPASLSLAGRSKTRQRRSFGRGGYYQGLANLRSSRSAWWGRRSQRLAQRSNTLRSNGRPVLAWMANNRSRRSAAWSRFGERRANRAQRWSNWRAGGGRVFRR